MTIFYLLTTLITGIQAPDTAAPILWAPGPMPVDTARNAAPAFSPDGRTVYFHGSRGDKISIFTSINREGKWSAPEVASFSGTYRDLEPAFAPDGSYLIFASSRPGPSSDIQVNGWYNGQVYQASGGRLWKISRKEDGWGVPEMLPDFINTDSAVFSPNIAGNGDLYYMRADTGSKFHLYCAKMRDGKYEKPEQLPFSNTPYGDYDPAIARDESFIIFSSGRPPAPKRTDLFIVFHHANGWGEPIDLNILSQNIYGVEARLSPDNKTLYFSNQRNGDGEKMPGKSYIWQVDLSTVVDNIAR